MDCRAGAKSITDLNNKNRCKHLRAWRSCSLGFDSPLPTNNIFNQKTVHFSKYIFHCSTIRNKSRGNYRSSLLKSNENKRIGIFPWQDKRKCLNTIVLRKPLGMFNEILKFIWSEIKRKSKVLTLFRRRKNKRKVRKIVSQRWQQPIEYGFFYSIVQANATQKNDIGHPWTSNH